MKNIFKIYRRDMKKIFTNTMAIILAVGISVLPSLYAWFNIYANWDPYGATGNMKVAVVISDEGFKYRNIERFCRFKNIDKVMRDIIHLFLTDLGSTYIHSSIHLHRIGGDYLSAKFFCNSY